MKTHYNIRKITTGQLNDYTTSCWLDYDYFKKHFSLMMIDLLDKNHLMPIRKQYNKLILQQI